MAATNGAKDTYGLTRDAPETARLDGQHLVWRTNIGFLLHPRIAKTLRADATIGEVGTGTGVWLLDLAKEQKGRNPEWRYHGLDMSDAQFPAAPPPGVEFATLNILDAVPAELENAFDVLHLRLLVMGLPAGTWRQASANILKLLKPGGWVQWEEADFGNMRPIQIVPGASTKASRQIILDLLDTFSRSGHGPGFAESDILSEILASAGFTDVQEDILASDRIAETRAAFTETIAGAIKGMMKMLVAGGKAAGGSSEWESQAKRELYDSMVQEFADGKAYFRADLRVASGRKAG